VFSLTIQKQLGPFSLDVSFEQPGGVTALIGASGSGKSTLLRCLNHLESAEQGSIRIDGDDLCTADADGRAVYRTASEALAISSRLGMVFQNFNLFPHFSVLENLIEAPMHVKGVPREEATEKARTLLNKVGLWDKQAAFPGQLSGGQQQRVAIARALALKPDILCFDEPTSALDPELTGEVLKVIKGLAERHTTMVIVTHEMAFAAGVADRVLFMDEGRVLADGRPADILENPDNPRIRAFLRKIRTEAGPPQTAVTSSAARRGDSLVGFEDAGSGQDAGGGRLERVVVADPAGNITALVFDDLRHLDAAGRAELNDAIIAAVLREVPGAPAVEQCGFVVEDGTGAGRGGSVPGGAGWALEMFGREFCGNATRSAMHLFGAANPVTVEMPLPVGGVVVTETGRGWLVPFDGITHLVVTDAAQLVNGATKDTMLEALRTDAYGFKALPAAGVSCLDEETGEAVFTLWVRDMDTLFAEQSCGSGTAAIAAALAFREKQNVSLPVTQPSGDTLTAAAVWSGRTKKVTEVTTTGIVKILYDGPLKL